MVSNTSREGLKAPTYSNLAFCDPFLSSLAAQASISTSASPSSYIQSKLPHSLSPSVLGMTRQTPALTGTQDQAHAHALSSVTSPAAIVAYSAQEPRSLGVIMSDAGKKALGGGIPGMAAMVLQVGTLMWLRTTINYQYRHGTSTTTAFKTLYKDGGIRRFYRGVGPALIQGPLSRFGDTAANAGSMALLDSYDSTRTLPVGVKTAVASASAGAFRILLMPVDALKTIMQVEGKNGAAALFAKVGKSGPSVLYHGALASAAATFVGHYPWFATYNYLNAVLPRYEDDLVKRLLRSAFMGFSASFISDCCSNSIRVIKTTKQTSTVAMTYPEVARSIIAKEGITGLMGRGLKTKILANGVQGIMFSVFWRMGQDYWNRTVVEAEAKAPAVGPQQQPAVAK